MQLPAYHFWSTICAAGSEHLLDLTDWETSTLSLPFFFHCNSRDITAALCYSAVADSPHAATWFERLASLWTLRARLGAQAADGRRSRQILSSFVERFLIDGSAVEYERADVIDRVGDLADEFTRWSSECAARRSTLERAIHGMQPEAAVRRVERLGCLRRLDAGDRAQLVASVFAAQHHLFPSRTAALRAVSEQRSSPVVEAVMHRLNARGVALALERPSRGLVSVWREVMREMLRSGSGHRDLEVDPDRRQEFDYVRGVTIAALRRDRREQASPPAGGTSRRYTFGDDFVELRGPTLANPSIYVVYDGLRGSWVAACDEARHLTHEPHPLPGETHV